MFARMRCSSAGSTHVETTSKVRGINFVCHIGLGKAQIGSKEHADPECILFDV